MCRYRHEICYYQDQLFVLGGGTSFSVYGFEDIPTFQLTTRTWTWIKTRPDENVTIDRVYTIHSRTTVGLWIQIRIHFPSWIRILI